MPLTEIKTKYDNQPCEKCQRIIRQGWKAYFEVTPDGKKHLYCKPCGEIISKERGKTQVQPQSNQPQIDNLDNVLQDISLSVDTTMGDIKLLNDLMHTLLAQHESIIDEIGKLLKSKKEKTETKK